MKGDFVRGCKPLEVRHCMVECILFSWVRLSWMGRLRQESPLWVNNRCCPVPVSTGWEQDAHSILVQPRGCLSTGVVRYQCLRVTSVGARPAARRSFGFFFLTDVLHGEPQDELPLQGLQNCHFPTAQWNAQKFMDRVAYAG